MMESLGQSADAKEIAVMVKEFDTDGNGVIDCMFPHTLFEYSQSVGGEFVKIMQDQTSNVDQEGLKRLWAALDKDNDGLIHLADLREVLTKMGLKMTNEEFDDMLRYADIYDEAAPININQFMKVMMVY